MVQFYSGNDANPYVTLTKPTEDVSALNDVTQTEYTGENIGKKTCYRGENMMLKIIIIIVVLAIIVLSYMTYVEYKEIKSLKSSIAAGNRMATEGINGTYTCDFVNGHGDGGSKVAVGYIKGNACVNACLHMKKIDATINGVTVRSNGYRVGCWCEQSMRGIRGIYKTCFLESNHTHAEWNNTYTCAFKPGDGGGGSRSKIGNQKGSDCVNACLHWKKINPAINGVTMFSNTSREGCWCDKYMTSIRPSTSYKTCMLESNSTLISAGANGTTTCNFSIGDGEGGPEFKVGYQKGIKCVDACLHMKKIFPTINGVTEYASPTRLGCWCEHNMTSILIRYKTCYLNTLRRITL